MPIEDALARARAAELDLVEVAAQADPPVCRIMDYGKFRYEEAQRLKESRKKTIQITTKEGHKVKVSLQFRGREMAHPELGKKVLDEVLEQLGPIAKVDTSPRLDGRSMTMVLSPDKKAAAASTKKPAATNDISKTA